MSKVLLITKEYQPDVDDVIHWLNYHQQAFIRITPKSNFQIKYINISNDKNTQIHFIINKKEYNLHEFKSIWLTNGMLPSAIKSIIADDNKLELKIASFLYDEWRILTTYIFNHFESLRCIGSVIHGTPNKLVQLEKAKACGLKIPNTSIVNSTENLNVNDIADGVTKPISEVFSYSNDTHQYYSRTVKFDSATDNTSGFPFLVQKNISKKFELRVFYFFKTCYACAIFSQENPQSKTDWRLSPDSIRFTPYNLPESIETKLIQFMDMMQLNTGSIDLIVSPNDDFVFLEINPAGIFQNISELTNYNIHKMIAEKLINYERN